MLEGHWIDEVMAFLSEHHALATAEFFFRRVERYAVEETYNSARPVKTPGSMSIFSHTARITT